MFVAHGGIGPSTVNMTLADIDRIDRFKEPRFKGEVEEDEYCTECMSELLWSGETVEIMTVTRFITFHL